MAYAFNLLSEQDLPALQPAIEDFYQHGLKQHLIERADNLHLSALEFRPPQYAETIVIIPGRAENEHKYAELFYTLRKLPLRILLLFARGQGKSSRTIPGSPKCHIEDFNLYRQDIEFMLEKLEVKAYRLLGFSMGGLISTDLCVNGTRRPERLALAAPYLWPAFNLPAPVLRAFVGFMGSIPGLKTSYTPHGSEYARIPFEDNYHSHSRIRYEIYHDYYASHTDEAQAGPTYAFVRQSLKKQQELFTRKFDFTVPVLCLGAGADQVVSTPHCQAFIARHSRDIVPPLFSRITGAYHDILNESDQYRNPAMLRILQFLTA